MALIACPACGRQVSEAAPTCPGCGHPIAAPKAGTFKDALTRPDAMKSGFTLLGLFVAAPWIARILALVLFVGLAAWVVAQKT